MQCRQEKIVHFLATEVRSMDSQTLLDEVGLARQLLENASRQAGRLSGADIVFGLSNLLRMKY